MVTTLNIDRQVEETYPLVLRTMVSAAQAMSVGYADIETFLAAALSATVHLLVPAIPVTIAAALMLRQLGDDAELLLRFALPVEVTDAAQARTYRVVFEPGSPTSERVLCQGTLTIAPRPAQT